MRYTEGNKGSPGKGERRELVKQLDDIRRHMDTDAVVCVYMVNADAMDLAHHHAQAYLNGLAEWTRLVNADLEVSEVEVPW